LNTIHCEKMNYSFMASLKGFLDHLDNANVCIHLLHLHFSNNLTRFNVASKSRVSEVYDFSLTSNK
jgi:hypothetical protein